MPLPPPPPPPPPPSSSPLFDVYNDIVGRLAINGQAYSPPNINTFSELAAITLNVILGVGFSLSIVAMAYSAYMYILSGGNPEMTKKAWNAFLWGFIGGVIILGSVALKRMVLNAIGVDIPELQNSTPGF